MLTTSNESFECTCGRDKMTIHCPRCGKASCYAKPSDARIEQSGLDVVRIMSYRCRGCGKDFDDLDRTQCAAPPTRARASAIKKVKTFEKVIQDPKMADFIAKARAARGLDKPATQSSEQDKETKS